MIDNLFTKHNEINQNKTEMKLNHFGSIRLLKKIGCFLSDTIYTNYEIVRQHETYDKYTSLCVELKTELGNIFIYGTIIGIFGNRNKNFKTDLSQQIRDYKNLSKDKNFCLIGDYNISFADNYYFTNHGRNELNKVFHDCSLNLLTRDRSECVDHIAISEDFTANLKTEIGEWNFDKKLSDHKGIFVDLKANLSI